ncbi:MAG TPA: hypothetical protein VJQ43_05775 [Thermoplasmata archaeon]|nr:hypothetical protein [Thermoplasmata archaeon]
MPAPSYERYGLLSNPFRDLASESLADVELFHVNLEIDRLLETMREEVLAKENRAIVALVGLHGAGKTERLLLTAAEARSRKAFQVYYDITTKNSWAIKGLAEAIVKAANLGGFKQLFSAPKWFRDVVPLQKVKEPNYDPVRVGRAIAAALNANAPAFLLLNDLHNLGASKERLLFVKTLQEVIDGIRPGVMIMFGAFPSFMLQIAREQAPLTSRINRTIVLPRLSADEAALLLAKKLLAKRIVEGLDPLYPFDRDVVTKLNLIAYGNPRRLLELSDAALEYGAAHRAYRIDEEVLRTALVERKVKEIDRIMDASFAWSEETMFDDPAHGQGVGPLVTPGRTPTSPPGATAVAPTSTVGPPRPRPSPLPEVKRAN